MNDAEGSGTSLHTSLMDHESSISKLHGRLDMIKDSIERISNEYKKERDLLVEKVSDTSFHTSLMDHRSSISHLEAQLDKMKEKIEQIATEHKKERDMLTEKVLSGEQGSSRGTSSLGADLEAKFRDIRQEQGRGIEKVKEEIKDCASRLDKLHSEWEPRVMVDYRSTMDDMKSNLELWSKEIKQRRQIEVDYNNLLKQRAQKDEEITGLKEQLKEEQSKNAREVAKDAKKIGGTGDKKTPQRGAG
ncbi:hypothetical protein GGR56DRAFT_46269 [Xylariaceae sp. FL0804]|nr:hypothetical protein GGR56DRAFT_46269 [Xylariaceae sp. FL0804]